ncbi:MULTISPECIES: HEAT repeat domain-containing protein [Haloarcula]|uniref:HEAT repeat domain-containing protein n=1 Tax=Haloarcula TaxID=2237 RepID=UPI0007BB449C|nr:MULTISPECIES: hypothetical protein [Haloarcula]KZX49078.1 hypothetical protein AV929_19560 [Haloarcula sp. K1]
MTESTSLDSLDPGLVTPEEVNRDALRDALNASGNRRRTHAAKLTATLAATDPSFVEPLVTTIASTLGDERVVVNRELSSALASLTHESTDSMTPAVEPLLELLSDEVPLVRSVAAMPIRSLAIEDPTLFVGHADQLLEVVEREVSDPTAGFDAAPLDDPEMFELHQSISQDEERRQFVARTVAVMVLEEATAIEPESVADDVDRLLSLLNDDDPAVVGAIANCITSLAQADADGLSDAAAALGDQLRAWEHDDAVRAQLLRALGFVRDSEAISAVRTVATDEDAPPELRTLAAETEDWLREQSE